MLSQCSSLPFPPVHSNSLCFSGGGGRGGGLVTAYPQISTQNTCNRKWLNTLNGQLLVASVTETTACGCNMSTLSIDITASLSLTKEPLMPFSSRLSTTSTASLLQVSKQAIAPRRFMILTNSRLPPWHGIVSVRIV